jgi:anaerobic selenocysteine-containing dehydrogenase
MEKPKEAAVTDRDISRRSFVKAGAAVTAIAAVGGGLAACAPKTAPVKEEAAQAVDPFAGAQEFYAACPPECQHHNLKALVKDGKIVKVEAGVANESLPCMRGLSRVEWLNTDVRLTKPLLRDGEKGEGKWKEISWDEATTLVADKLKDAIATVGNAGIVCDSHAGNFNALAGAVAPAFMARIGGGTTLTGTLCCAAVNGATTPMFGRRFYDTRNTIVDATHIIIWGNNPAVTMNGYFDRFEQVMDKGGKIVTIDPVHSESASKSTDWVSIRPTTDSALALGMLKVIVDEKLHNEAFLKAHSTAPCLLDTSGKPVMQSADDKTSYVVIDSKTNQVVRHDSAGVDPLLTVVGTEHESTYTTIFDMTMAECAQWTPEAVEAETGVPAAKVVELAREYATAEKSMIIQNMGGFMRTSYGTYAVASQNNLAVFTGHIGSAGTGVYDAGGITNHVKLTPMFDNPKIEGLPSVPRVQFAHHVLNDTPNPIKVFISSRESPMTQWPNTGLLKEALKKIPFVVVIDSLMTSTALYADLVLPCAAVFETEDLMSNARSHLIQLSDKAIDPPGEAHDDLWIFTEIAKKMGVGADFEHNNEFFIRKALEGTDFTYEELKEKHAIDAYPKDFIPYANGEFYTATKKAEIYQGSWISKGVKPVPSYYRSAESVGGSSGLDAKYPLAVVQRKTRQSVHGTFGALKLMENVNRNHACVMINTKDASARGISDGDSVVVYNDRGEHKAKAIVTENVISGVLVAENGWWEQQGGSSSYVTNDSVGVLSGEHCCNETLAEIKKG